MIKKVIFCHYYVWVLFAILGYIINLLISLLIYAVDFFEYGSKMSGKQLNINASGFNLSNEGYKVAKDRELDEESSIPPQ